MLTTLSSWSRWIVLVGVIDKLHSQIEDDWVRTGHQVSMRKTRKYSYISQTGRTQKSCHVTINLESVVAAHQFTASHNCRTGDCFPLLCVSESPVCFLAVFEVSKTIVMMNVLPFLAKTHFSGGSYVQSCWYHKDLLTVMYFHSSISWLVTQPAVVVLCRSAAHVCKGVSLHKNRGPLCWRSEIRHRGFRFSKRTLFTCPTLLQKPQRDRCTSKLFQLDVLSAFISQSSLVCRRGQGFCQELGFLEVCVWVCVCVCVCVCVRGCENLYGRDPPHLTESLLRSRLAFLGRNVNEHGEGDRGTPRKVDEDQTGFAE